MKRIEWVKAFNKGIAEEGRLFLVVSDWTAESSNGCWLPSSVIHSADLFYVFACEENNQIPLCWILLTY